MEHVESVFLLLAMACETKMTLTQAVREKIKRANAMRAREVREEKEG